MGNLKNDFLEFNKLAKSRVVAVEFRFDVKVNSGETEHQHVTYLRKWIGGEGESMRFEALLEKLDVNYTNTDNIFGTIWYEEGWADIIVTGFHSHWNMHIRPQIVFTE